MEDCEYSTIVNHLWNREISDEVDTDKSMKHIINDVVIGQLEKGINTVQSSCIFHTLEEARGYQTLNGGTMNIITKQDEISTVEIVESYPEMNEIHWSTRRIHDELEDCIYIQKVLLMRHYTLK